MKVKNTMLPIRVLQVVGKMHYGGMETLIMNIYRNIDRSKVQFDFLVHYSEAGEYDEEIRQLGGKIYHMPRTIPRNYFKYKKALQLFYAEHDGEYSIVHGHLQSTAFLYHKIAKENGVKCCITHSHATGYDNNLKSRLAYYTSLKAQKYTDIFMGCSQMACEFFFPHAIKLGKQMYILKNGIQISKYVYSENSRDTIRKELCLENKFVVGHIGRFSIVKNHGFLLNVFAKILKKRPASVLLLVGEGPLKDAIQRQANDLNIQDSIRFLGTRNDVNLILQAMDVFVLPSQYEGLGIVLIEAQAAGLKCFASSNVVPQEAQVTQLLEYLDLQSGPEVWADKILNSYPYNRQNTENQIVQHGYDISQTAQWLQNFYLEKALLKQGG